MPERREAKSQPAVARHWGRGESQDTVCAGVWRRWRYRQAWFPLEQTDEGVADHRVSDADPTLADAVDSVGWTASAA
ncbi:hypothetical protein GCM10009680_87510 [Streptomyces yatensis]|uniref:Uncharacterized protein n=1 Tax=Streptomyces yatensis TaxID=155177 RepID=A0ABP4VS96_9ACTN